MRSAFSALALGYYGMNFRLDFGIRHWLARERAETSEDGFEGGSGFAARFSLNPRL